ncbi:hypothetical protein GOODEAATRI_013310 [Goodea atripinnis]|uniref:Uncharacterized protein n=1 Tax=Goodea atripinnis TaxID=208336 RepID=A0ABV0N1V7_9TELE
MSVTMSEAKKGELAIRDKAILHQQRRLKQATQFTHKDSADLLPLDGLKRLGTSKDLTIWSLYDQSNSWVCILNVTLVGLLVSDLVCGDQKHQLKQVPFGDFTAMSFTVSRR